MSFFVFDEIKVLFFPDLLNFVEFLLIFELLDGLIDNLSYDLLIFLKVQSKYLIKSHGFDGDFERVSSLFHEFLPMSVSNGAIFKLNDKWNWIFKSENFVIELIVNNISGILLGEFSFESIEEFIEDFLEEFSIEFNPQSGRVIFDCVFDFSIKIIKRHQVLVLFVNSNQLWETRNIQVEKFLSKNQFLLLFVQL